MQDRTGRGRQGRLRVVAIALVAWFTAVQIAEAGLQVSLQAPACEAMPRSFATLVLDMRHTGTADETVDLELHLPAGWQTISSLAPIRMAAGTRLRKLMTVAIPPDAIAGADYRVACTARVRGSAGETVRSEAHLAVGKRRGAALRLLPHDQRAYPGEAVSYRVQVINLGNARDDFTVTLVSGHRWSVRSAPRTITLGPGESQLVTVTVRVPSELARRTTDRLRIAVAYAEPAAGSPALAAEETMALESLPTPPAAVGSIYPTLPARLTLSLLERSDGPPEAELGFAAAGNLPNGDRTAIHVRQPVMGDDDDDYYRFDLGNDRWDISLGDTNDRYTRLTSDLHGRGARLRLRNTYVDASAFAGVQNPGEALEKQVFGSQVVGKPGPGTRLALTMVDRQEHPSSDADGLARSTRQISALADQELVDGWWVGAEVATSDGREQGDDLHGSAWRVNSTLQLDALYGMAEVYRADADYTGGLRDRDGYRTYWRYNLTQPLSVWLDHERYRDNLDLQADQPATLTTRTILGTQLALNQWPVLTVSGELRSDEDLHPGNPMGDVEARIGRIRVFKTFRRFNLAGGAEWAQQETRSGVSSTTRYDASIAYSLDRYYGRLAYRTSAYRDNRSVSRRDGREYWEAELGGRLLDNRLRAAVSYRGDLGSGDDRFGSAVRARADYRLNRANTIGIESEFRQIGEPSESWLCLFTWTHTFGMPVPFVKTSARASGRLFVDRNDNGRYDDGEPPLPKVAVGLAGQQVYTDRQGAFRFAPVEPGTYDMTVETAQLPADLHLARPDGLRVPLGQPGDHVLELPVSIIGGLGGTVFEDANGNGVREANELPLGLVRLVLQQDGEPIGECFAGADGTYLIADLMPGTYDLCLDTASLPPRYQLTTPNPVVAEVGSARRSPTIDFGCRPIPRTVIRTFSR